MICFGTVAAGALLFVLRKSTFTGGINDLAKTGIGLWLCLIAKIENKTSTSSSTGTTKVTTATTTPTDATVEP